MRYGLLLLALMLAAPAFAQQSAFEQGKALGNSSIQGTFNSINSGNVQDKIPAYGTSPAETQFYQGGQGELSGPGISKMQNCATATPDSDPIKRQECEAVNFLARNPQIRPQFNIDRNDPMFAKARDIGRNAENIFQSMGINGGTGSSTQCTTKTETTPAQYTTETCSSFKEVGEQQCTMGRVVNIDTDTNFQCEQTVKSYEQAKCRKTRVAQVTQNCTYEWITRTWSPPRGPWGKTLSTYDDLRYGPQSVCNVVWPGSSVVSASCNPPPTQSCYGGWDGGCEYTPSGTAAGQGCDHLHNGGWFTSSQCYDQGWCSGSGIASISCRKQELVCNPVVTFTTQSTCETLEARAM